MRIASVQAAPVTNRAALGRTSAGFALETVAESMNPLGGDRRFDGDATRYWPPWSDVVCIVTAVDGTWGLGMTTHAGPVVPLINDFLGPMLVGLDGDNLELLWDLMAVAAGSHLGLSGVTSYAISAVDLALWDLRGKHEAVPVYDLLGGPVRSGLECYATGNDAGAYAAAGFNAVKLACWWGEDREAAVATNVDRFLAAREAVGPAVAVRMDGWAIQDPADAIALGRALTPHGVDWLEDYVFPEDWVAYGEVRRCLPDLRLASGERWYGVAPFELAVEQGYVDIWQPDALWVGGATAVVRIAALAEAAGITLGLHCAGNDPYGQHLAVALAPNTISEMYYGDAIPADLMATLRPLPGMAAPLNGHITPHDASGFGIELSMVDLQRATA